MRGEGRGGPGRGPGGKSKRQNDEEGRASSVQRERGSESICDMRKHSTLYIFQLLVLQLKLDDSPVQWVPKLVAKIQIMKQ